MSATLRLRVARKATALAALVALAAPAPSQADELVDLPVRFTVENVNRSKVPCPADGATYEVAGHLVAPASALEGEAGGVTLYLHGLGYGEFYWRFRELPGYDYATAQAQSGHASVVIDRLGYDASSHPAGNLVCIGAHADVAHQIVGALRSGAYSLDGGEGQAFSQVALAGHSLGTQIAQVAAYSFGGIDALVTSAYASDGATPLAAQTSLASGSVCARGGEAAEEGQPGGYAYFGQAEDDFRAAMFHDAEPAAIAAATPLRNRDPCGDHGSVLPAIVSNRLWLGDVSVPVLIVCGANDALFRADRCTNQSESYGSSPDVSTVLLPGTGHALTLERTREQFRSAVSGWLAARGF